MTHRLTRRITDVLALDPAARAIEYDGHWHSWGQLDTRAREIATASRGGRVGIMLRNSPVHVAALLGVLLSGGTVVTINPSRGQDRVRSDLASLDLPMLIGTPDDIDRHAAALPHTTVLDVTDLTQPARVLSESGQRLADSGRPEVAVCMLTSGTTGPPKRVDLSYDMLAHSVLGSRGDQSPTTLRRGVAIVNSPLVHVGGVFRVLLCIAEARPFVLLPRFELEPWARAVRAYRPAAVSLVPAALRMVLHSALTRDDLAGVRVVTSGTAPLAADDADAFTEKFGIPVLTSYAATEFGGGVASWTLADHQRFWQAKRGSTGRANPGAQLRVVGDDGTALGADQVGLLEVKPAQIGPDADWMQTTDLARIDTDGFLWIVGRADQAIIRGGFKVMPDEVRAALESHPAVQGAAVVGRPDPRLGETPVALVELRSAKAATPGEILEFLRDRLSRYEIPTDIVIVERIPRTPSGKPDLHTARRHFAAHTR